MWRQYFLRCKQSKRDRSGSVMNKTRKITFFFYLPGFFLWTFFNCLLIFSDSVALSVVHLSPLGSQLSFSNATRIENVTDWEAIAKKYRALMGESADDRGRESGGQDVTSSTMSLSESNNNNNASSWKLFFGKLAASLTIRHRPKPENSSKTIFGDDEPKFNTHPDIQDGGMPPFKRHPRWRHPSGIQDGDIQVDIQATSWISLGWRHAAIQDVAGTWCRECINVAKMNVAWMHECGKWWCRDFWCRGTKKWG